MSLSKKKILKEMVRENENKIFGINLWSNFDVFF